MGVTVRPCTAISGRERTPTAATKPASWQVSLPSPDGEGLSCYFEGRRGLRWPKGFGL